MPKLQCHHWKKNLRAKQQNERSQARRLFTRFKAILNEASFQQRYGALIIYLRNSIVRRDSLCTKLLEGSWINGLSPFDIYGWPEYHIGIGPMG